MILGSFVFRNDGDGCLSSKYINTVTDTPYVECCKLNTSVDSDPFLGTFTSAWIEGVNNVIPATLVISKGQGDFYRLEWNATGQSGRFLGQGMIYQGLLMGSYWDVFFQQQLIADPNHLILNDTHA